MNINTSHQDNDSEVVFLDISQIRLDGGTQPRSAIHSPTLRKYALQMKAGAKFPPVIVFYDGIDYWLADGFHRVEAASSIGLKDITTLIKQGSRREAILYSVGANTTHGLRRSNTDKRRAVLKLLEDPEWSQWSNREIARRVAVNEKTVRNMRQAICGKSADTKLNNEKNSARKVKRDGKVYSMDITNIGKQDTSVDSNESKLMKPKSPPAIDQRVTVIGNHLLSGLKGRVTALPNRNSAIVEFENGQKELMQLHDLDWWAPSATQNQTVQEGINYRPGLGCEWYVKVKQSTWERLIEYQKSVGCLTPDAVINRLLDEFETL